MSVESFKEFSQRVATDEDVFEKVKEIGQTDIEGIINYADELGYSFSVNDMVETAKEAGVNVDELSEEQLEKVAGGAVTVTAAAAIAAGVAVASLGISVAQGVTRRW